MIKRKTVRLILGTVLGGFAGLSMTTTVLPTALSTLGMGESFFIRFALSDYAAHAFLVWAVGGWSVARVNVPLIGAILFALLGAVTGVLLALAALGSQANLLLITGGAGAVYGLFGGLLIASMLPDRPDTPPAAPDETGRKQD